MNSGVAGALLPVCNYLSLVLKEFFLLLANDAKKAKLVLFWTSATTYCIKVTEQLQENEPYVPQTIEKWQGKCRYFSNVTTWQGFLTIYPGISPGICRYAIRSMKIVD